MPLTRRELLGLAAAGLAGSAAWKLGLLHEGAILPAPSPTPRESFVADIDLALVAAPDELRVLPGGPTTVWRFTGRVITGPASSLESIPDSWLGPTIRLRRGQRVRIRFSNRLPEPSIVHWHGLDVPEDADGH